MSKYRHTSAYRIENRILNRIDNRILNRIKVYKPWHCKDVGGRRPLRDLYIKSCKSRLDYYLTPSPTKCLEATKETEGEVG